MAFADHSLRADYNHGRPPVAATARPAMFHGSGAFAARAAGGPVRFSAPHSSQPMRADRPSWASGQKHTAHPMMHGAPGRGEPGLDRPEQQRFEARPQGHNFESRPQSHNFEAHGSRPIERPQPQFHQSPRSQPQFHESPRPQPQFHGNFRAPPHEPVMRGPAPRPQQRGGGERPHHPPEERGHGR